MNHILAPHEPFLSLPFICRMHQPPNFTVRSLQTAATITSIPTFRRMILLTSSPWADGLTTTLPHTSSTLVTSSTAHLHLKRNSMASVAPSYIKTTRTIQYTQTVKPSSPSLALCPVMLIQTSCCYHTLTYGVLSTSASVRTL